MVGFLTTFLVAFAVGFLVSLEGLEGLAIGSAIDMTRLLDNDNLRPFVFVKRLEDVLAWLDFTSLERLPLEVLARYLDVDFDRFVATELDGVFLVGQLMGVCVEYFSASNILFSKLS